MVLAMKKAAKGKAASVKKVMKAKKVNPLVDTQGEQFEKKWTPKEFAILKKLNTPQKIQDYIDKLGYDGTDDYFSVRSTLKTKKAHCMGGALLAACCLERLGYGAPRIMGIEAENDDSHAIAVYQKNGYWGAVAKSNFTLIRARAPVYKTVRELMMSYFDFYFNTARQMSLTHYCMPYDLNRIKHGGWKWRACSMKEDLSEFDNPKKNPLVTVRPKGVTQKSLGLASKVVLKAGLIGSNPAGLYKPGKD
jgi:hypothetical protein